MAVTEVVEVVTNPEVVVVKDNADSVVIAQLAGIRGEVGPIGPQGIQGLPGPANVLTIGTVTESDTTADATITGVSPNQELNLTLRRGPQGIQGIQGVGATVSVGATTTGAPGSSASVINSGTAGDAVFDFVIPRGDQGQAATVQVGTTTTGAAGTSASVNNVGTSSDAVLNFVIPRGDTGIQGEVGPANTLTVGTVSSTDTEPQVTITGSSPNQVINFVLQRGPQGPQGIQGEQGIPGEGSVNTVNGDPGPDIVLDYADVGAEPAITGGTTAQFWRGDKTWVTPTKSDVGLANVDNTSDLNKPVSTATQTALNSKADLVGGVIPTSQLPPLAINETFVVASEAAMLALTAQRGDMAIREDTGTTFVLAADDAAVLGNWKEISSPGDVLSVNGYTGTIVLTKADLGLGNVDNTSDANKPISTATQTALNATVKTAELVNDIPSATGVTNKAPTASLVAVTYDGLAGLMDGRYTAAKAAALTNPVPIGQIPTGTTATTVALGNHTHAIDTLPVATSGTSNATQLVRADDLRLSNARTPTAHNHAGTDITSGIIATARLGSGTANNTTFLRGDNTWAVIDVDATVPIQTNAPTADPDGSFWYDSDEVFDGAANVTRVLHNGTAYPARPTGATYVEWVGPVAPTAQITGDTWVNTA